MDSALVHCSRLLGTMARADEPLGPKTTYRVGGRAALFCELTSERGLDRVQAAVGASGVEVLVVGKGSNLLVADAGFPGLALRLAGGFAELGVDARTGEVRAGAAAAFPQVARRSVVAGLTGLEWAVGIPGSVGGAVAMNAGGHGSQTAAHLLSARVVDLRRGTEESRDPAALDAAYRHTNVAAGELVVEARFRAEPAADPAASGALLEEIVAWRRRHQPGGRNCGSVFTNPPRDSAGRLIELCGLKGLRVGTAVVSPKHANFIQADAGGRADDVRALIELVRDRVLEVAGVELSPELRMVGFGS